MGLFQAYPLLMFVRWLGFKTAYIFEAISTLRICCSKI